jgi:hypothetical protein
MNPLPLELILTKCCSSKVEVAAVPGIAIAVLDLDALEV